MKNLKVKTELIGAGTSIPGIGQIKIREDHVGILAQAGRWDLLEGDMPGTKKLIPVAEPELAQDKPKNTKKKNVNTRKSDIE